MDREMRGREMSQLGAAPHWVVDSDHVVTEEASLLIASASRSQARVASFWLSVVKNSSLISALCCSAKVLADPTRGVAGWKRLTRSLVHDVRAGNRSNRYARSP